MHAFSTLLACAALLPLLPLAAPAQAAVWTHDLEAAKQQAAAEGKLVLVEFTGSDWCTYCVQLNRQVLSTDEFAEFIAPRFIPVQIDVPIRRDFNRRLLERNQQLCKRYSVPGFPTLMVLTPQGEVVGGFRGDPGNGMEGVRRHLEAAQKFARILAEAEALQGLEKARALHAVYSALQPCMRPSTGLRVRIAALDPNNATGIHDELQAEQQREHFRRELAATRDPKAALELTERHLATASLQNRTEILQARAAVLLAIAETEADLLAVKQLLLEIADSNPRTAAQTKAALEARFADPAQVLEHIRRNPPTW